MTRGLSLTVSVTTVAPAGISETLVGLRPRIAIADPKAAATACEAPAAWLVWVIVGEVVATGAGRLVGSVTQPLIVPRSMSEAGCVE